MLVHRDQERITLLVTVQRQHVACQDRRRPHAVETVERAKRQPPAFDSVKSTGDDSEIREEDEYVLTIADGTR